jgi:hypothetical protein
MYEHVAVGAVLIPWIRHVVEPRRQGIACARTPEISGTVMAFETQGKHDWPAEKPRIRRAVRVMAHLAAFHPNGRVFERKGATLIAMALNASLFVSEGLIH